MIATVVPVVLGTGKPLFDRRLHGGPMRLAGTRAFDSGMVELRATRSAEGTRYGRRMAIRGRIRVAVIRRARLISSAGLAAAVAALAIHPWQARPRPTTCTSSATSPRGTAPARDSSSCTRPRPRRRQAPLPGQPGLKDLKRLGAWFGNPDSAVSSHVANDEQGHDARYVSDGRKAWTEVAFNSVSLSIEQIGTDEYSRGTWLTQRSAQLQNTAEWIARWHRRWGIPISRAKVSGSTVVRPGVTTHAALGSAGGGHDDPGPGYPFGHVLVLARSLAAG